jgi:hypothetical protein
LVRDEVVHQRGLSRSFATCDDALLSGQHAIVRARGNKIARQVLVELGGVLSEVEVM